MTFAEYLKYTPPPGMQDELLNGEIALSPGPNRRHQDICHQLHRLLEALVRPEWRRTEITRRPSGERVPTDGSPDHRPRLDRPERGRLDD